MTPHFVYLAALTALLVGCLAPKEKNERSEEDLKPHLATERCSIRPYQPPSYGLTSQVPADILVELENQLPANFGIAQAKSTGYSKITDTYHYSFTFNVEEIPLCNQKFYAKAHVGSTSGRITGNLPSGSFLWSKQKQWSPISSKILEDRLNPAEAIDILEEEDCTHIDDQSLVAARRVSYLLGKRPYEAIITKDKVVQNIEKFFRADGEFEVYSENIGSGKKLNVTIKQLDDSGYLCNTHFITILDDETQHAFSEKHQYFYDAGIQLEESSAFVNANLMMNWFLNISPDAHWSGTQVAIKLTDDPYYVNNGPEYHNPHVKTQAKMPTIVLPSTMGKQKYLVNLRTDFDVVAHELGHHIVSKYMDLDNSPQVRMLHEGLADYFVFAKTQNTCLGETICNLPGICALEKQCLRSAENSLKYFEDEYTNQNNFHIKSQLVSATLWDITHMGVLGPDEAAALVLEALNYVSPAPDFSEFFGALLTAEAAIHKGAKACDLYKVLENRNLNELVPRPEACPPTE